MHASRARACTHVRSHACIYRCMRASLSCTSLSDSAPAFPASGVIVGGWRGRRCGRAGSTCMRKMSMQREAKEGKLANPRHQKKRRGVGHASCSKQGRFKAATLPIRKHRLAEVTLAGQEHPSAMCMGELRHTSRSRYLRVDFDYMGWRCGAHTKQPTSASLGTTRNSQQHEGMCRQNEALGNV